MNEKTKSEKCRKQDISIVPTLQLPRDLSFEEMLRSEYIQRGTDIREEK